jgi:hypothetical protein
MKKNSLISLLVLCAFTSVAQWNTSGTNIYNSNTGNIGIGTATPGYKLDVFGPANDFKARFQGTDGYITIGPANSSWAHIYTDRPAFIFNQPVYTMTGVFSSYNTADLSLQTGGTPRLAISNSNGYVGLGTTTPSSKLHINSGANARETVRIYYNGNTSNYLNIWQGTGGAALDPIGTGLLYLGYDQSTNVIVGNNGGNLGVGTTTPQAKLQISNGDVLLQNQTCGYPSLWLKSVDGANTLKLDYNSIIGNGGNLILRSAATSAIVLNDVGGKVGVGTTSPQTLLNIAQGAGDATVGTPALRIGGTNNYQSLEFGIKGAYDGMISTFGNDLHIYAGNWRTAGATASENHNISFYTSESSSTNWNTAKMFLRYDGNLGIGTTSPNQKLTVNGTIYGKEVKVDLNVPGPDYVFEKDYKLPSLEAIKSYIDQHKHLPEVPSAKEMEQNGINVSEMNMILLKKMEELTLYMLELKKDNEQLRFENKIQNKKIALLEQKNQ